MKTANTQRTFRVRVAQSNWTLLNQGKFKLHLDIAAFHRWTVVYITIITIEPFEGNIKFKKKMLSNGSIDKLKMKKAM